MEATQAFTGQGGWPMTCLLTADGRAHLRGTYFPRAQFQQLLRNATQAWATQREAVLEQGADIARQLREQLAPAAEAGLLPEAGMLDAAVNALAGQFDQRFAGFGGAPKFPPSMLLEFLLRAYARAGDERALDMVARTCQAMARGGMYDQLGGGFARYSVDAAWVVPHFEKMLYDNGLLLRAYLHWWRISRDPLAERVVRETITFLLRDLLTPQGGFASSLDADAAGSEGSTYVWTPQQLVDVLGTEDGEWAAGLCAVTRQGTFEHGASTLQLPGDPDRSGSAGRGSAPRCSPPGPSGCSRLGTTRSSPPGTAGRSPRWPRRARYWMSRNGWRRRSARERCCAICTSSTAGCAGSAATGPSAAQRALSRITARSPAAGSRSTRSPERTDWLEAAGGLLDAALADFPDGAGGFFDSAAAADGVPLLRRPQDPTDNATPSGASALCGALVSYAAVTGALDYREAARGGAGQGRSADRQVPAVRRRGGCRRRGDDRRTGRDRRRRTP